MKIQNPKPDVAALLKRSVASIVIDVKEAWLKGEKVSLAYANKHFAGKRGA